MENLVNAMVSLANPLTLIIATIGVMCGVFFGAMPGINGAVGVALLLPVTYSLSPANGLLMLGGLYMGSSYGGSISAILLNCPGSGEAACTALDGNPMARQGKAKAALYYSVMASSVGGIFGVLVMIFFTPMLADAALKFGPPEMFLVTMAGLAVVGSLMGKRLSKGFFAVSVGLLLSMIGSDTISGNYRFVLNSLNLQAGIALIPLSVGVFAITEMITLSTTDNTNVLDIPLEDTKPLKAFFDVMKHWKILFKSTVIGTIIGILPGTGGAIASFVSYGEAKRSSKDKDSFGKGNVEGIIAPESANNAAVGGSFIPLLALGIPGSATSAIIFGALTVHGILPGPKLFIDHAETIYTFMTGMLITSVVMLFVGIFGVRLFSRVLKTKVVYVIPIVLAFSIIGAYSARNSTFDIGLTILFAIMGVFFRRSSIPTAPIILGLILGSLIEQNLRRSILMAAAKSVNIVGYILMRPISAIVAILLLLILFFNFKDYIFKGKYANLPTSGDEQKL